MMKTAIFAAAMMMGGAAAAQTTGTDPVFPNTPEPLSAAELAQPSNANPELDARGIPVISQPAVVPDGWNGTAYTGVGGPEVDPVTGEMIQGADDTYPICTAEITDNCVQAYEVGRH